MLILQEGAGVYSPDCRDLSVELKERKDAPCSAVSRDPYRPAEMNGGLSYIQEFISLPGLTVITYQTICAFPSSLSDTVICFALIFFLFH